MLCGRSVALKRAACGHHIAYQQINTRNSDSRTRAGAFSMDDVRTTSIATSMAILRLADENLLMLAPCEVQLEAAPINAVLSKVTPEKFLS